MRCFKCKSGDGKTGICDDCVRRHAKPLSPENAAAVRAAMTADPASSVFYLFHDGHVESRTDFMGRLGSRAAQLVSITTDGIPMVVGRRFMDVVHPVAVG
jgi:hypothetical protein